MDKAQAITLVEYNTWAKHRVLIKAPHLTSDERLRETTLSHQTTLGTLIHILDTQWYWEREGAQSGKLPTDRLSSDNFRNLAALRRRSDQEDRRATTSGRSITPGAR